MLSNLDSTDNVIKNMAKEIVRDCGLAGVNITFDVAVYLVHLKFLKPEYGYTEDKAIDRNFTQPIVTECVKDFVEDSVWINILKMQSYSETNVVNRRDVIKAEYDELMWKRWKPGMKEIIEADPIDKDGYDKLWKKMVTFMIVFSGLGNPMVHNVIREAQAALQSIFKYTDLDRFISQPATAKEEQLIEFGRLVKGIRLFNKDCQKGGDGIDDLPLILTQASQKRKERIINILDQLNNRINELNYAFDNIYYLRKRKTQVLDENMEPNIPPEFAIQDLIRLKRVLCMIREHEYYLRKLLFSMDEVALSIEQLIDRFRETLLQLHDVVRYRSAVPTIQVYPLFNSLTRIWEEMQREAAVLSEINNFMSYLQSFDKYEEQTPLEIDATADQASLIKEEEDAGEQKKLDTLNPKHFQDGITIVTNSNESLAEEPQYSGYCAWTLSAMDGLLIPGDASIGYLRYKNRIYSFSTILLAAEWAKNPERHILNIYKIARSRLELVKVLELYDDLYKLKTSSFAEVQVEQIVRKDGYVQTVTHPIPRHIDPNYSFSLWEHKRRALQLSYIINYQTKSQQTVKLSHFRSNFSHQAGPDKSQATQTMRDNSCNHPTVKAYLYGLRGLEGNKFQALELTRPVDEERQPEEMFRQLTMPESLTPEE